MSYILHCNAKRDRERAMATGGTKQIHGISFYFSSNFIRFSVLTCHAKFIITFYSILHSSNEKKSFVTITVRRTSTAQRLK